MSTADYLPAAAVQPTETSTPAEATVPKKKGAVRFASSSHGEVEPPAKARFERSSSTRFKAREALESLLAGNERFRKGELLRCRADMELLHEVSSENARPSAIILACSDSRVPPELICDQGLGDCHVVRVAGNVVNDFVLGSILFAVQHLGVRLVAVLGHSRCSIVASAVQSWVRHQSAKKLNPSARAMAEGVQRALADGPLGVTNLPASNTENQSIPASAFAPASQKAEQIERPGLLSRLCGCGGTGAEEHEKRESVSGASTPMQTQGAGPKDSHRNGVGRNSTGRGNIGRSSINPLAVLVGAIGGAVETVANSKGEGFKGLVHRSDKDLGWDSDDEDLKKGLQKQDSLEFTRARLAKQREERKIEALRKIASRSDVDFVVDENAKVSANSILKGLVKNVDAAIISEVEVVAIKYDIDTGILRVLNRQWYSNRTYLSE